VKDETKELLILAAKAMGFEYAVMGDVIRVKRENSHDHVKAWWPEWSPLKSGDDLVEMECQLSLETIWAEDRCIVTAWFSERNFGAHELYSKQPSRRAAKAMASLRVVAEIGRRMEEGAGK